MEIKRNRQAKTITLCQSRYIKDASVKFNLINSKHYDTPMENRFQVDDLTDSITETQLQTLYDKHLNGISYGSACGTALYASLCTRPDISYAMSILCRYVHSPTPKAILALKRVLIYLKLTPNLALIFGRPSPHQIESFCDSDWCYT